MKKYTVNSPLKHDDRTYAIGEEVELSDKHAAPLLALEGIALVSAAPQIAPEGAVKLAAIQAAIAALDKSNADLWMKDGRPKTGAIEAATGWPVSAAERDAAYPPAQS